MYGKEKSGRGEKSATSTKVLREGERENCLTKTVSKKLYQGKWLISKFSIFLKSRHKNDIIFLTNLTKN